MTDAPPALQHHRPNYGIDAPGLVRGFFAGGVSAGIVATLAWLSPWPGGRVAIAVAVVATLFAVYAPAMGCYMLYGSLIGKVRDRERLLDLLPWNGTGAVLDVGCGRGLLLVAAARRLPSGRAIGVDLWQAEDQSGNRPEAAMANAAIEGVAHRVEVRTGDARQPPFSDASFDAVVSHWVIHNLYDQADRERAFGQMARVLKPGGWLLIADIAHHQEYVRHLQTLGFAHVRHVVSRPADFIRTAITFGSFRPGAVVGQKP